MVRQVAPDTAKATIKEVDNNRPNSRLQISQVAHGLRSGLRASPRERDICCAFMTRPSPVRAPVNLPPFDWARPQSFFFMHFFVKA